MHSDAIERVLEALSAGKLTVAAALDKLRHLPYEDLSFARIDHHRDLRQGIPEVIFARGKTPEEVRLIAMAMHRRSGRFLISKADLRIYEGLSIGGAVFHQASGMISVGKAPRPRKKTSILVVSAGTSDIPIAEEAAVTASFLGSMVETEYDIGIAGIHRLLDKRKRLSSAKVIVVVAGMEGALPSVVGGLVDRPVIAVPTSTGYGTSLGGLTALFAMLNSCVPGIAVMNIDNGFGAGCLAHRINSL